MTSPPDNYRGILIRDEPMSRHTSLKVGGPADLFAIPENIDDLRLLISWLLEKNIQWLAIGKGYNLLVRDKGIRGAVISLERFNRVKVVPHLEPDTPLESGGYVLAEAGADNLSVVRFAQQEGLGGITFISGIPGTIGGAIRMNAGAYGQGILEHTECLTLLRGAAVQTFCMADLQYGYRHLHLESGDIVLSALFKLTECNSESIEKEICKDIKLRRSKHNVGFPSAGSFFKNPSGQASWRLIDAAGMRGIKVGAAQVSPQHSNFLVNTGGATAQDFLDLAATVKNAVFATSGVTLEEEVRILGES